MLRLLYVFALCFCISYNCGSNIVICENKSQQLECETGEVIQIKRAIYGRTNKKLCAHPPRYMSNTNCYAQTANISVANTCNNKISCTVFASNKVFGDPCPGTYKYLSIENECIKVPRCTENEFECRSGQCIENSKRCNGHSDCSTGEDELGCTLPCKGNQFQCINGTCVPRSVISDGIRDCPYGEDELGADYKTKYICQKKSATIKCGRGEVLSIIYANYGRLTTNICSHKLMSNTNCRAGKSLNILINRCNLKDSCAINSSNTVFGNPCVNTYKYTEVHYQCIKRCTENEFQCDSEDCIENSKRCDGHLDCSTGEDEVGCDYLYEYACEYSVLHLKCKVRETIKIIGANYGRQLTSICIAQPRVGCLAIGSKAKMQAKCDGRRRCSIEATNAEFGDPCKGTNKYLEARYKCIGR